MIVDKFMSASCFYLLYQNKIARYHAFFILILSLTFCYSVSVISGLLLVLSFAFGFVLFNILWNTYSFDLLSFFEVSKNSVKYVSLPNAECNVCGELHCKRQRPIKDNQPWLGLSISKDVDQAIQDLFNKILNEFVTSWYSHFTKDETFILELRKCLRYASSILLKRFLQMDIGEVITDQLLTTGLKHVNDYENILQMAVKKNISVEAAAVRYLNKSLHPAVHSRKSELQYLRSLSDLLANYLLQASQLKCLAFKVLFRELLAGWVLLPITDILCDSFYINSLLLLAVSHDPLVEYPTNSEIPVQFLHRFVIPNKDLLSKKSAFQSNLSTILKDQKLLYSFMQFLKKEGVVHILQFCLDVEEFSRKILNPELNQFELDNLHKEASNFFSIYFKHESSESIHFPKHIIQQMEQILESGPTNIAKLRTNPALFKAYEIAFSTLEENYCPLFYLSDDFFPLLCGERQTTKFAKVFSSNSQPGSPIRGRNAKKSCELSTVNKLSSKFQKLLQFQAVEGKAYFSETPLDMTETECTEDLQIEISSESVHRDMSSWRLTVPSFTVKQDSNAKPHPVFNISVVDFGAKENDETVTSKWNVERRYNDFYLLQGKLTEFHGEFEDGLQLPPKTGVFSPRGSEFLENRRQLFEEYLQKLLKKPNLKGSDLLYLFLHSSAEFSSCLSAQDGIGKILRRSVEPIKLRKERGQHLENFLNVFLASTEGTKKTGKYEWLDISVDCRRKKRDITRSTTFHNNFQPYLCGFGTEENVQKESLNLLGPWDCIFYTMSKLMDATSGVMQMAVTFKNILGLSSDLIIKQIIRRKIETLLVPGRVSHLVRLLQDALFCSSHRPAKQSHKILKDKLMLEVDKIAKHCLLRWFFPNFNQGVEKIVDTLQHPILNKQLCYCLLDEVVRILFPELAT